MILAENLPTIDLHTPTTLGKLTKRSFDRVTFLGITNAGQHCYRCSTNQGDRIVYTKVFTDSNKSFTIET
jgi:hypothetical protein